MEKQILEKIKSYDTIIIHRHERPDMDAIGSQVGLYHVLKDTFPQKKIYMVGDINDMSYHAVMDMIEDDTFKDALSIVVDVAVDYMVSDKRYELAREVIVIDHHKNDTNLPNVSYFYHDPQASSAAMLIVELIQKWKFVPSSTAATYLYGGMVTDTNRFMYISNLNAARTFAAASFINEFNPDITGFYDYLYTESLAKKQIKLMFSEFETTPNGVAYRKNTHEMILKSGLGVQGVSRGMVNLMAGIKEIPIWASFTEDKTNNKVICEFRARGIVIVDIAKKYGGGGHDFACGASLTSFEEVEQVLEDLDRRAKEWKES